MCVLVNHDGWKSISEGIPPDEIAERMRLPEATIQAVLNGEFNVDTTFIGAALNSFPMGFNDLFRVPPRA